ncbi:hypothetical protein [Streptomyces fradiae]|uniref:hypothetical protein n=1 Tax=Streptomyces fradiae TaxID=1906 RepID=UPI003987A44C
MTTRNKTFIILAASTLAVASAGFFTWRNTNFLGPDSFCQNTLTTSQLEEVLGQGRLTQNSPDEGTSDVYDFHCSLQRASILSERQSTLSIDLTPETAAFPFQTRTWKEPSNMSYLVDSFTGAVSETKGWAILPDSCWEKIPMSTGNKSVPVVELNLQGGTSSRSAMAHTLVRVTQHVTETVGCSAQVSTTAPVRLIGPTESSERTDASNACGLTGFRLPAGMLLQGKLRPGTERFTTSGGTTSACDLFLVGGDEITVTFSASQDATIVDTIRRSGTMRDLELAVCRNHEMYLGVSVNDPYADLAGEDSVERLTAAKSEALQSFKAALMQQKNCA